MAATIIDGAGLAAALRERVAGRGRGLTQRRPRGQLTALLVGSPPAGGLYAERQRQACEAVGIGYRLRTLPDKTDSTTLAGEIQSLNDDPTVTGIMLHLPLPAHLDATEMQYQIDPVKDVEGVNPA